MHIQHQYARTRIAIGEYLSMYIAGTYIYLARHLFWKEYTLLPFEKRLHHAHMYARCRTLEVFQKRCCMALQQTQATDTAADCNLFDSMVHDLIDSKSPVPI